MKGTNVGPRFFVEATATGGVYLETLEQVVHPQVEDLQPNMSYQ
jgi:hypothetical protein